MYKLLQYTSHFTEGKLWNCVEGRLCPVVTTDESSFMHVNTFVDNSLVIFSVRRAH